MDNKVYKERQQGVSARESLFIVSRDLQNLLKPTLGPKGMDKTIVNPKGNRLNTNDGATIIQEINAKHPVFDMFKDIARTQDYEIGDGTTSTILIAGELLNKGEYLMKHGIHVTDIIKGYYEGMDLAKEYIEKTKEDKEDLRKLIRTTTNSKVIGKRLEELFLELEKYDKNSLDVAVKEGLNYSESKILEGIGLDYEDIAKRKFSDGKYKIGLFSNSLEETDTKNAQININNLSSIIEENDRRMNDAIYNLKEAGINFIITSGTIDELGKQKLEEAGIYAIRSISYEKLRKISDTFELKINTFENVQDSKEIELEIFEFLNEDILILKNKISHTLFITASNEKLASEIKRITDDVMGIISVYKKSKGIVYGAGAIENGVYNYIMSKQKEYPTLMSVVLKNFAEGILIIPKTLMENSGMNTLIDMLELNNQKYPCGINIEDKTIIKISDVVEPSLLKTKAIEKATETAIMILRIDDIVVSQDA